MPKNTSELKTSLAEAIKMLRRGIKAMERQEWEKGETQQEWLMAARQLIGIYKLTLKIEREQVNFWKGGRG